MRNACQLPNGGAAPATPGFNAFTPEWLVTYGAADAAPTVPAAESTLGSHPCVALSSAQVLPEWINRNLADQAFAANGDNPLTSCLTPGVHFTLTGASPSKRVGGTPIAKNAVTAAKNARNNTHFTGDSKPSILRSSGRGAFRLSQSASLNDPRQKAVTFVPRDWWTYHSSDLHSLIHSARCWQGTSNPAPRRMARCILIRFRPREME